MLEEFLIYYEKYCNEKEKRSSILFSQLHEKRKNKGNIQAFRQIKCINALLLTLHLII
jgi:hypothetical protein